MSGRRSGRNRNRSRSRSRNRRRQRQRVDRLSSSDGSEMIEGRRDVRSRTSYFYRHDALNVADLYDYSHQLMIVFMMAALSQSWVFIYGSLSLLQALFSVSVRSIRRAFVPKLGQLIEIACFSGLWATQVGLFFLLDMEDNFSYVRRRHRFSPDRRRRIDEWTADEADRTFRFSPQQLHTLLLHWRVPDFCVL